MQDRKLYYFSQSGHRHIRWPALLPLSQATGISGGLLCFRKAHVQILIVICM